MAPVLNVLPPQLIFHARPGDVVSQTFTITNPLASSVSFLIKPSATRYGVDPSRIELGSGGAVEVVVELRMPSKPPVTGAKELPSYRDTLHIKSNYFDQRIHVLVNQPHTEGERISSPPRRPQVPGRSSGSRPATKASSSPRRPPPPPIRQQEPPAEEEGTRKVGAEPTSRTSPVSRPARGGEEGGGGGPTTMPTDVKLMIEESSQRLKHSLTREFNEKCEQYMQLFSEKDELLREKDDLLIEKEQALEVVERDLARARARQRELETTVKEQVARTAEVEASLCAEQEEKRQIQAEWEGKELRWRLEQTDREVKLQSLQAEVDKGRHLQGEWEEEKAQWRLEQADLHAKLQNLEKDNERLREALNKAAVDEGSMDQEGTGLGEEPLPPPSLPSSSAMTVPAARNEKDDLLLHMLQEKIADQKEMIDVLVAELDKLRQAPQVAPPPEADLMSHGEGGARRVSSQQQQQQQQEEEQQQPLAPPAQILQELESMREMVQQSQAAREKAEAALVVATEEAAELRERVVRLEELQAQAKEVMLLQEARLSESAALQRSSRVNQRHRTSASYSPPRRRSYSSTEGHSPPQQQQQQHDHHDDGGCGCLPSTSPSSCAQAQSWWLALVQTELKASATGGGEAASRLPKASDTTADSMEALRDAGVEIARLRQEVLAKEIEVREVQEDTEEQLRAAGRRINALEHSIRTVREENNVKLRELETSVRVLAGRSDLHRALACVRQELAGERVTVIYLRGELALHKRLLKEEEDRAAHLRDRVLSLQNFAYNQRVEQSMRDVPGTPHPLALIQHFAGLMAAGCTTIEELRNRLSAAREGRRKGSPPSKRRKEQAAVSEPPAADGRPEPPAVPPPPPPPPPSSPTGADVDGLSQRFSRRVGSAQLLERQARLEEELSDMKEEALRLRLEAAGAKDAARREAAALEETHRNVVAALHRQLQATQAERTRMKGELDVNKNRVAMLEDELMSERCGGGVMVVMEGEEAKGEMEERQGHYYDEGGEEQEEREHGRSPARIGRRPRERRAGAEVGGIMVGEGAEVDDEGGEEFTRGSNANLASLLDERTAQVSVLMESVEALQGAVMASREMEREEAGLLSGNWAVGKLVKRVVALTIELSNAVSLKAMAERRADKLTREAQRKGGERSRIVSRMEEARDEARRARTRAQSVLQEHRRTMKARDEKIKELEGQLQSVQERLVESEGALTCCQEHKSELEVRVRHLEEVLAATSSSIMPPLAPAATDAPWQRDQSLGSVTDLPQSVFCEACGALTLRRTKHPEQPPGGDGYEASDREPACHDKASYLALVREVMDKMQHWHEEAMSAAVSHPLGAGSGPTPANFMEFFVDTVADILTSADEHYVTVLQRSKALEWKLKTSRLEVLREVRDRERADREVVVLKQCVESYREATIRRRWHELASEQESGERGWLQDRYRQQADVVSRQEARLAWLEAEKERLEEDVREAKESLGEERKKTAMAEASLAQNEASQREEARRELEEVVLPRLEEMVSTWCETEMPQLFCGPAPKAAGRLDRDSMAMVEAICVSKAVNTSLQTRLEAALADLDKTREQVEQLSHALSTVTQSRVPAPKAGSPSRLSSHRSTVAPPPPEPLLPPASSSLRARVLQLEEELVVATKSRDRSDRLLKTLATENEALRATAEVGSQEEAKRVEREEEEAEELTILRREVARLSEETKGLKEEAKRYAATLAGLRASEEKRRAEAAVQHASEVQQQSQETLNPSSRASMAAEIEKLGRKCAQAEAQCRFLEEEVFTKEATITALRESLSRAAAAASTSHLWPQSGQSHAEGGSASGLEAARVVEELANSRLAEAAALRRLRAATENEVALRHRVEQLEAEVKHLQTDVIKGGEEEEEEEEEEEDEEEKRGGDGSHPRGGLAGRPVAQRSLQGPHLATQLSTAGEAEEGTTRLTEEVARQASVIAYLELRLAQATAAGAALDLGVAAPSSRRRLSSQSFATTQGEEDFHDTMSELPPQERGGGGSTADQTDRGVSLHDSHDTLGTIPARPTAGGGRSRSVSSVAEVEALREQLRAKEKVQGEMEARSDKMMEALRGEERLRRQAHERLRELEEEVRQAHRARQEAERRLEDAGWMVTAGGTGRREEEEEGQDKAERQEGGGGTRDKGGEEGGSVRVWARKHTGVQVDALPADESGGSAVATTVSERERMSKGLAALREQVAELYKQAHAKEEALREDWDTERAVLETRVLQLSHELLSARTTHAQALQSQREAYDKAISELEAAAELHSSSSREEVAKVREELASLRREVQEHAADKQGQGQTAAGLVDGDARVAVGEEEVPPKGARGRPRRTGSKGEVHEEEEEEDDDEDEGMLGGFKGHRQGARGKGGDRGPARRQPSDDASSLLEVVPDHHGQRSLGRPLLPLEAQGGGRGDDEWERREEEMDELKGLYRSALQELRQLQDRLQESEARIEEERRVGKEKIMAVSASFRAYREKQADIVATLEHRVRETRKMLDQARMQRRAGSAAVTEASATTTGGPTSIGGARRVVVASAGGGGGAVMAQPKKVLGYTVSPENQELLEVLGERERQLAEADNKLRRLTGEVRTAAAERDQAIEAALGGSIGLSADRDDAMRAAVLEARLVVAEQMVEELHREVQSEREAGNDIRRELAARILQMATMRRQRAGPSTQSVLKQLADFKRSSKTEVNRLKTIIKHLQSQLPSGKEYAEIKAACEELKASQASAREDLARKSRLLASYKASRTADEHAIAQWKAEVASLEERVRSQNRELYRKEAAIRELRSKVSDQRAVTQEQAAVNVNVTGSGGAPALVYPDARLKAVVAERDRLKQRCATLEKKIADQGARLEEASSRIKAYEEGESKVASLRAALQRKEGLLKAAKTKIVSYAQELSGLKTAAYQWQNEAERHLKQLQKRSVRWAAAGGPAPSGGEQEVGSLDEIKQQLQGLARTDAGGVRSLVLSTLALIHEDTSPSSSSTTPMMTQQQQPQQRGEEEGGYPPPGQGGGEAYGPQHQREVGGRAATGVRSQPSSRRNGSTPSPTGQNMVDDIMHSIDSILAQPQSNESGHRLAALIDGFMEMGGAGGGII